MPAPTLVSSSPSNGATNVAKNARLSVVLSTALSSSSIDNRTVYLRYEVTKDIVPCSVNLDDDGVTIVVVPATLLIPNSAYKLILVGASVSTTCVKAADDSSLATSIQISFQSGDTLAVDEDTGIKTVAETTLEGDAVLPDDIGFRTTINPLRLIRTSPRQHGFGMATDASRIRMEFSSPIDIDTVADNVEVSFEAFYGEEDFLAIETDIGEGTRFYFQYETENYTGDLSLSPTYFEDPSVSFSVTGNFLDIEITPATGDLLPNNLSIQVDILDDLASTSGATLTEGVVYFTCVEPYPKWDSLQGVRHEIGSSASFETPDDFIGLRLWRASIDLWMKLFQEINLETPSRYHKEYVRVRAAIDVWDDLMVSKYLNSGIVKELGDLRIQYNTGSGGAKSRRVKELEDRLEKLYRNVFGYYVSRPAIGIKSEWDHWEPTREYFRDRMWKLELAQNKGEAGLAGRNAANTAFSRKQAIQVPRSATWFDQ